MRLLFAHHSAIYKANSEGSSLELVTNTTAASGLDFHYQKNLLFWSDTVTRKVCISVTSKYSYLNYDPLVTMNSG